MDRQFTRMRNRILNYSLKRQKKEELKNRFLLRSISL